MVYCISVNLCKLCLTWRGAKEPLTEHQTESTYCSYCQTCGDEYSEKREMPASQRKEYIAGLRVADRKALKKGKDDLPQLKANKGNKSRPGRGRGE